jgi:hypothetical protein
MAEHICKTCGKTFCSKRKKQKFCSPKCCHNYERPELQSECKLCGKKFKKKRKDQVFCSRLCADKGRYKENACVHCGSTDMYNRRVCRRCFFKKKEESRFSKVECIKCHEEYSVHLRYKKDANKWICKKCKTFEKQNEWSKKIKLCRICKRPFLPKKSRKNYCSKRCGLNYYAAITKSRSHICLDCGNLLTKENMTHKSTSRVCDYCMWKRKRKYKASEKYGDLYPVVLKIKDTDLLTKIGLS